MAVPCLNSLLENQRYENLMTEFILIQQTSDWVVIDKPPGMNVHMENEQPGITSLLKKQLDIEFLAPVHRLDKATSGCLLFAKNSSAASFLSKQFQERQVEKYYLAITKGKPKKKQGLIIGDMVPARRGSWKLLQTKTNPAVTQFFSWGFVDGLRLVYVRLLTGKTHQIRVAMKSIGSPIWGDLRYGEQSLNASADRCYLHSFQLSFRDLNSTPVTIKCFPSSGNYFQKIKEEQWSLLDAVGWPNPKK